MFRRFCATFLCLFCGLIPSLQAASLDASFVPLTQPRHLPPMVIQKIGGLTLTTRDVLAELAGSGRVYLHLWAPSCPPCVKELRKLDEAYPVLAERGIAVLALAEDPDGAITVPLFVRRHGIKNLPLYIDSSRAAWRALNARGIPSTYLMENTGRIVSSFEGPLDWSLQGEPAPSR